MKRGRMHQNSSCVVGENRRWAAISWSYKKLPIAVAPHITHLVKSVYIETTIPSIATSRPSRDTIIAGCQADTLLFWENERFKYDPYISQYVIDECTLGVQ